MEQPKFTPKGNPTDVFDKNAHGLFQSDLMNLAYDKHLSKQRNLLYIALISICVLATVYISTTANYKTYVVRVDNATGQVETTGPLVNSNYEPQEAEIQAALATFVERIRTIPLDPVQYKENWNRAQLFLTQPAAQKLNHLIAPENQVARLGRSTTAIKIRSIQKQPGSVATYQVRWSEEEFNISGGTNGKKDFYVALFSVVQAPSVKPEEVLINPLRIKIADLNYAKETAVKE